MASSEAKAESLVTITPALSTTKRGLAAASCAMGFWGSAICWWYPFGLALATVGLILGLISVIFGFRAGRNGEHLAWYGIGICSIGISIALTIHRFFQLAFESILPWSLP